MRLPLAVLAPMVSALAHALMLLILARNGTPGDIAQIIALQAAVAFILTVVEFGIGRELSVSAARGPASEYQFLNRLHLVGFVTIGSIAAFVVVSAGFGLVPPLVLIYSVAERRVSTCLACSIATGRIVASSLVLILVRLLALATLVIVDQFSGVDPSMQYLLVTAGSSTALAVILHFIPRVPQNNERERRSLKLIVSVSWHYWATTLMGQARTLDTAVVTMLVPMPIAASYALPARSLQPLRLIGTSLANVAFPLAARGERPQVRKLISAAWMGGICSGLLVLLLIPVIPSLVDLVIGPGYSGASVPLVLFALGAAVNLPGSVISSALQASGRQRQVTILGVVLLILQMLSLVLLVKLFSINGAAAAILLTYIAQLLIVVFLYRRHGDGA